MVRTYLLLALLAHKKSVLQCQKRVPSSLPFQGRISFNFQLSKHLQAYINPAGIPIGESPLGSCLASEAQFPIINLVV